MRMILALILIALAIAGCATNQPLDTGSAGRSVTVTVPNLEPDKPPQSDPPDQPLADEKPKEAEVFIYPTVPRHPAATSHQVEFDQMISMTIRGANTGELLAWYKAQLEGRGWKTAATVLPPEQALLFSYEDRYLSIVGHDISAGQVTTALIRFHQRHSPEVTQAEARSIASHTHQLVSPDLWIPTYFQDYETKSNGLGIKHPVWVLEVKSPHSSVTVWVDAITAEAFQVRQTCDY